MMNKKGAEKIMSVYWFAILILVAGAVSYMVYSFYGEPYDVRYIESGTIIENVADCISENGHLKFELGDSSINLEDICHFNFDTDNNEGPYFVQAEFYGFGTNKSTGFILQGGNENLKHFVETNPNSQSVRKLSKNLYVLSGERELTAKITAIVNKENENIKQ